MKNILVVIAHPDDLELMAGGSVLKWISEGKNVNVLTFTHGSWRSPSGSLVRSIDEALQEERSAAKFIGYNHENLMLETLSLSYSDQLVAKVILSIGQHSIDTIICPFKGDLHHDHEVVYRVALAASRRVPNILMGQINYYMKDFFTPNVFVDITSTWGEKISALKMFEGQWKRAGEDWMSFLDSTSRYYGKIIGVERAEGFYSNKLLL